MRSYEVENTLKEVIRMANSFKKGGGNKPQPYIPKGNGEKSGQYAKNAIKDDYLLSESCTRLDLEKLLSKEEFSSIQNYTKYQIGSALNKAIRDKAMSKEDVVLKDRIVSAISKHKLKAPIITYRGIVVSKDVYEKNFLARYIFDLPIDGSLICSTSRDYGRASTAAKTKEAGKIGIIFCCELPKGYPALPVEGIAKDKAEREILISAPRYVIEEITNCRYGRFVFKRIKVKIMGDKYEN